MAHQHLEVRRPDGEAQRRRLSRRNPIVVGRNPISDVHVDDNSVPAIHCRVSWNGSAFEVAAVSDDGVDVNGVLVRRKELTAGDVIRVGDVDLVMLNGSGETANATAKAVVAGKPVRRKPVAEKKERRHRMPPPSVDEPVDEAPAQLADDEWHELSAGEVEMPVMQPLPPAVPAGRKPAEKSLERASEQPPRDESALAGPEDEPVLLDESPAVVAPAPAPTVTPEPKAESKTEPTGAPKSSPSAGNPRGWSRLASSKRPGEQDVLTSPLVLGLGGLALILLLAAGAIWLLIGREGSDRLFEAAEADRQSGRYAQAISGYEQFLLEYPGDRRNLDVQYALGLTRIERHSGGSSPDFSTAVAQFDEFVRNNRDSPRFDSLREPLREIAQEISLGASAAAIRTGDRKLLTPAEEGQRLFDRYAASDGSTDATRRALSNEFAKAETAVRKREYFDAAAEKIDAAIAKNDFATAFGTRFDLLTRYPDLRNDRRVRALLTRSLDAERQLIQEAPSLETGAAVSPAPTGPKVLTLIGHTQARAGEVSDGRLVFAVARNSLVAIDAVTGRPQWRQAVGLDTPFFPLAVDASVPALLAFDAGRNQLVLFERETGTPLWRTPLPAAATGPPLVAQGQIDLATADGKLIRLDLESGTPLSVISLPQPVIGPPVLAREGERLITFGAEATAYTLDLRTLEPQAVSLTGHAAGALDTPGQTLGQLIVICENDQLDSAAVKVFRIEAESGALQQVASERIPGQVRQTPVARGNLLFVSSTPERITAFSISDDAGQPPLTRLSGIQIPDPKEVKTFLVPGPEGMLWAAGSALRKLRLAADGIELRPGSLAPGRHTQPPQESGNHLFVARTLPSAAAVYVSRADRDAMTGSWRTILGARPVAVAAGGEDATIVTEAGLVATVNPSDLDQNRFLESRPLSQWEDESPIPIDGASLDGARAVVWRGGKSPLLWLFGAGELPGPPRNLKAALECAPITVGEGLILPMPGRLSWMPQTTGAPAIEDFLLPVTGEEAAPGTRWQSLVSLGDDRLAACDATGLLRMLRVRREPLPHLDEVASLALDFPLSRPLASTGERLVIVLKDEVRLLDPAGLRPVAEATLPGISGGPWSVDGLVFIELEERLLVALDETTLEERWRFETGGPIASHPLRMSDGWCIASQTGSIIELTEEGIERRRVALAEPLTGLETIGERLVAISLDGSLLAIDSGDENDMEQPSQSNEPEPAGPAEEAAP